VNENMNLDSANKTMFYQHFCAYVDMSMIASSKNVPVKSCYILEGHEVIISLTS